MSKNTNDKKEYKKGYQYSLSLIKKYVYNPDGDMYNTLHLIKSHPEYIRGRIDGLKELKMLHLLRNK